MYPLPQGSLAHQIERDSIVSLRIYFKRNPDKLIEIFETYVNNAEKRLQHATISLKVFSLLSKKVQQEEASQCILKTIFAAKELLEGKEHLLRAVLIDAFENNNWSFIFNLLELGVSKNIRFLEGDTLLHLACRYYMEKEAVRLIEMGADVDAVNAYGQSCLHFATKSGLAEVVAALLEKGCDMLALNEDEITPLQIACQRNNLLVLNLFKQKLDTIKGQVHLLEAYLSLGMEKQGQEIVSEWKSDPRMPGYLLASFDSCELICFFMEHIRAEIEEFVDVIRVKASFFFQGEKLKILPLLHPEEIGKIIQEVPEEEIEEWLGRVIRFEEGSDEYFTIKGGLLEVNSCWISYIHWDASDSLNYSDYLINKTYFALSQIPLYILSAAARDEELYPVLKACLPLMNFDQVAVIVPHLDQEDFIKALEFMPIEKMCVLLKTATDEQKFEFFSKVLIPSNPLLENWSLEGCHKLLRKIEALHDVRYTQKGKEEEKKIFKDLFALFESVKTTLPFAIKKERRLLKSLRKSLLVNTKNPQLIGIIRDQLGQKLQQNLYIKQQLKGIRDVIENDSLYGILEKEPPSDFLCGIFQTLMKDPVTSHGHTFEREAIAKWLETSKECPICRKEVSIDDFIADSELRIKIYQWEMPPS